MPGVEVFAGGCAGFPASRKHPWVPAVLLEESREGVRQHFGAIPRLPWVLCAGAGCVGLTRAGAERQTQGWFLQRERKMLKILGPR